MTNIANKMYTLVLDLDETLIHFEDVFIYTLKINLRKIKEKAKWERIVEYFI